MRITFTTCLLLIAAIGITQPSFGDTLRISSDDPGFQGEKYDLNPYLYALPDSNGIWTIEDISSDLFQKKFTKNTWIFDQGPEIKAIWARITLRSELDYPLNWIVNLNADKVEMFLPIDSDNYDHKRSGLYLTVSDRFFKSLCGNLPCLPLHIPPDSSITIYFKQIGTIPLSGSREFWEFNRSLFSPESYNSFDRKFRFFNGILLGILIAVSFYHFIIFLYNRNSVFLLFSFFVLAFTNIIAASNGYISEFIFPNVDNQIFGLVYITNSWNIVHILFYLFSRSYLQLKKLLPLWDKIWAGLVFVRIGLSIIILIQVISAGSISNTGTFLFWIKMVALVHILVFVTAIIASILSMKKGNKHAGFYLIAMAAFIIQQLETEFQFSNIDLPYLNLGDLGITITVLLYSLGIARLIKSLEKEKIEATRSQALLQTETDHLKAMDEFKTRFYTNISHEFRTPLTVILGMVDQIKSKPENWYSEGLKMIKRNGQKLMNLTNQMLSLSKLEANALPVNLIQGDIVPYLKYLVESFHSFAAIKNIDISFSANTKEIHMDFDPEKIQDILSNLVSNAIKFTPNGGKVNISVSKTDLADKSQLVLSVKDTGTGISQEHLPRIFDRYFQVENNKDLTTEGTGLGLSLTRELVKLLNGKITVESPAPVREIKGSIFKVYLPVTNQAMKGQAHMYREEDLHYPIQTTNEQVELSDEGRSNEKLVLLLVEDNDDVIQYLRSLLAKDYHIEIAQNGQEGFEQAISNIPDLVISDVMMPVMDGFTFCQKLKSDLRTSHIPLILLTARADAESKLEGLEAGADAYLAKPFNREELFVRIKKLIELRKALHKRYKDLTPGSITNSPESMVFQKEDAFLQDVRRILEDHLSEEDFGIAELCRLLGMSRSQLYRKFKALTDTTVQHFIRNLRLDKAKELLITTNLNVTEVALETGFKNLSHFSKVFFEKFGIPPSKFQHQ